MKLLNGSIIYKENDPPTYIYLIKKGEAEVIYCKFFISDISAIKYLIIERAKFKSCILV